MQAEVDVVGISLTENDTELHAIDVAFHESGLNYGSRQETVTRVIKKLIRTSLCMVGYFGIDKGVIFAAPKIHNAVMDDLEPCIADLNTLYLESGSGFTARVIANDDFNELVLKPILIASDGVSDTSELFMRSYQLVKMFGEVRPSRHRIARPIIARSNSNDALSELKIGRIAQTLLRDALESGKADEEEISLMLTKDYSKNTFDINFPLLVFVDEEYDPMRYYVKPLKIRGTQYLLCSQWFEYSRPFLLAWLNERTELVTDSTENEEC